MILRGRSGADDDQGIFPAQSEGETDDTTPMTMELPARWSAPHREDVVAGLSVAVILVPQALAYAEIAGMPPYIGLYAAAVPTIAAAFLASSRYLQTGPVAMTSLLTFGALSTMAVPGSSAYVALGVLLALVVGATRLALGLFRGGVVAYL
ncbi:MAG: SulP family inorganic anion transporter, partial [Acidimicrobiia bacterium]